MSMMDVVMMYRRWLEFSDLQFLIRTSTTAETLMLSNDKYVEHSKCH